MDRKLIPQPLVAAVPALEGSVDSDAERCRRCRQVFEDNPTLDIQGRNDPSLCPRCEAIVLPRRPRSSAALTLVPPLPQDGHRTGPGGRSIEHPSGGG